MKSLPLPWTTVFAKDDNGPYSIQDGGSSKGCYFIATAPWMKCADVEQVRAHWEINTTTDATNMKILPGFQIGTNEDAPGAANVIDDASPVFQSTPDVYYPVGWLDISSTTAVNSLIRFGFVTYYATTDALHVARVTGRVDIKTCT